MEIQLRPANVNDVKSITNIYNEAILKTTATFDTEPKSFEERLHWFNQHDSGHPVIVAECNGVVAGWASLSRWSDRCAYEKTSENSVYVGHEFQGKGIGKMLLSRLVSEAEKSGTHYILARITEGNEFSIRLHKAFGFEIVGVMHEVGYKFGKFLDVTLMEKVFKHNG